MGLFSGSNQKIEYGVPLTRSTDKANLPVKNVATLATAVKGFIKNKHKVDSNTSPNTVTY